MIQYGGVVPPSVVSHLLRSLGEAPDQILHVGVVAVEIAFLFLASSMMEVIVRWLLVCGNHNLQILPLAAPLCLNSAVRKRFLPAKAKAVPQ